MDLPRRSWWSEPGSVMKDQVTQDTLQRLYDVLDAKGLRSSDLIPELRREGKNIKHLSELTEWEARKLIQEASPKVGKVTGPTKDNLIR